MFTRTYDQEAGIIFVHGTGFWTHAHIDEHFAALITLITEVRAAGGRIRVLSDLSVAPRQDPAILYYLHQHRARSYQPGDRLAVLTADKEKAHVRTLIGDVEMATFSSRLAAEMWLMTDDIPANLRRRPSQREAA